MSEVVWRETYAGDDGAHGCGRISVVVVVVVESVCVCVCSVDRRRLSVFFVSRSLVFMYVCVFGM